MEKEAFEPTGLIPRSIIRTVDRFVQQLLPGKEKIALQEYRVSRYQILVSIKSLLTLVLIPLFLNSTIKALVFTPIIEHFWNSHQAEIFLNQYQEKRAFSEMHDFSEKMFFESLLIEPGQRSIVFLPDEDQSEILYKNRTSTPISLPCNKEHTFWAHDHQGTNAGFNNQDLLFNEFTLKDKSKAFPLTLEKRDFFIPLLSSPPLSVWSNATYKSSYAPFSSGDGCTCKSVPRRGQKEICTAVQSKALYSTQGQGAGTFLQMENKSLQKDLYNLFGDESSCKTTCMQDFAQFCQNELPYTFNIATQKLAKTEVQSFLQDRTSEIEGATLKLDVGDEIYSQTNSNFLGKENTTSAYLMAEQPVSRKIDVSCKTYNNSSTPLSTFVNFDNDKYQKSFQIKSLELAKSYNKQSILAITNLLGDFLTFFIVSLLFRIMRPELIILKSFLTESVYSLSDTTKSFLLILGMDLLVGFHSPRGWELALEGFLRHIGLPENENFILLFVALFPVFLDTVFKYWIFRYLNKISPSTVVTYHSMIE